MTAAVGDSPRREVLRIGMTVSEAQSLLPDKRTLGPLRVRALCFHSERSGFPVAEVWGDTVIADGDHHSLEHYTGEIAATCRKCRVQRIIDLPALRARLRAPGRWPLKLDIDEISRRVPPDD